MQASVFDGEGLIEGLTKAQTEIEGTGIREETDIVIAIGQVINFILMFAAILAFVAFVVADAEISIPTSSPSASSP